MKKFEISYSEKSIYQPIVIEAKNKIEAGRKAEKIDWDMESKPIDVDEQTFEVKEIK